MLPRKVIVFYIDALLEKFQSELLLAVHIAILRSHQHCIGKINVKLYLLQGVEKVVYAQFYLIYTMFLYLKSLFILFKNDP